MIGTGAFWQTLAKKIREKKKEQTEILARGGFGSDIAQARELVGNLAMLDWVLGQAADILGDKNHPIAQPVDNEEIY